MFIHKIFSKISPVFRNKRFQQFLDVIKPSKTDRILDVGGYPFIWTSHEPCAKSVDVLNIHEFHFDPAEAPHHKIQPVMGNGCDLVYPDDSYEIVFSNSVIEHVGTWENQLSFAKEMRRVGKRLWIQTPAFEFFIEPHYIAPFLHWLPRNVRRHFLRYFTIWGWSHKPNKQQVNEMLEEIRLISYSEMRKLFPDCDIIKERWLGIMTKSYVAVRL